MADEDLANFDIMSAFAELLPENINVTENTEESGKTSGNGDVQTNIKKEICGGGKQRTILARGKGASRKKQRDHKEGCFCIYRLVIIKQ